MIQTPSLVKEATNGVLYNVYKHPEKLWGAMSQFFAGPGGLLAMLRMQADLDPPTTDPGAIVDAKEDLGVFLYQLYFLTKMIMLQFVG